MEFNIADLFESLADVIPERDAVVAGDHRLTWAALEARANRLAHALAARGVGPGQHVGLHLYNGAEFVEGMIACFKLRAVPINVNYRYVAAELRYLFDDSDAVALITQEELLPEAAAAGTGLPLLKTVLVVADGSNCPAPAWPGAEVVPYEAALAAASPARDFGPRSPDDIYIIYTGGTTGMPKGVMWRHEDVFFAGLQGGSPGGDPIERPEQLAENAADPDMAMAILPAAPFIHGAAQWAALISMFTGGKVLIQPGKSFDAARVCDILERERGTTLLLVGDAMARPIADELQARPRELGSLVAIASGGAILSATVRDQLQALVPEAMVLNNFGATETGHQGSAVSGSDSGQEGRPSFFMDESNVVLDEDNKPLAPGSGKLGRIARRGRMPVGYYKDPVKTAERFVTLDGTRYTMPGDWGVVEEDGRITVYGRGAVCINTGGEKVFPEEVEEALKAHPEVFDVLVVGVPDPKWMQRVAAVVQPRPGKRPTLEALQEHARKHVAGYKVPRQLHLVEKVSRYPSGKPDYAWAKAIATDTTPEG